MQPFLKPKPLRDPDYWKGRCTSTHKIVGNTERCQALEGHDGLCRYFEPAVLGIDEEHLITWETPRNETTI